MAVIQNDRDVLLQAAAVRVVVVPIAIGDVTGLPEALAKAEKSLEITASAPNFTGAAGGATTPTNITLTAVRNNALSGTVSWVVEAGVASLTPSGGSNTTCSVSGSSVLGASVIIRARVTDSGRNYDARISIGKFGALTTQDQVNLATQITGQLANGNVSGLGALALLPNVNLSTAQVVGDLAATRIGVGTLAAGVIYAGTINADKVNSGSFSGKTFNGGEFTGNIFTGALFRTATSGRRIEIDNPSTGPDSLIGYDTSGSVTFRLNANQTSGNDIQARSTSNPALKLSQFGVSGTAGTGLTIEGYGIGAYIYSRDIPLQLTVDPALGVNRAIMRLTPQGGFPSSAVDGDVIMHSTKGLCFYIGGAWVKCTVETP